MPVRRRALVIGLVLVAVAGAFLWRYGDTLGGVDKATQEGEDLVLGWAEVDVPVPALGADLPGIGDSPDGIPSEGSYLVNLWASTCVPCIEEMPLLERLSAAGKVEVIGVTRDNLLKEATKAIRERGVRYDNLRDEFGDFQVALGVVPAQLLPASFLVVDGRITWTHLGEFTSYAELRDEVTSRL